MFLYLLQKVVELLSAIYTFLQLPRNIKENIVINGDFNLQFSAPLFYYPVGGLINGDLDSNFSAPLFYKAIRGLTSALNEIVYALIFDSLTPALNSTVLQFYAKYIT